MTGNYRRVHGGGMSFRTGGQKKSKTASVLELTAIRQDRVLIASPSLPSVQVWCPCTHTIPGCTRISSHPDLPSTPVAAWHSQVRGTLLHCAEVPLLIFYDHLCRGRTR